MTSASFSRDQITVLRQLLDDLEIAATVGHQRWQFMTGDFVVNIVFADLDGDGFNEILVSSEDRSLYCLRWTGELIWVFNHDARMSDVVCNDINNDDLTEIVVVTDEGNLLILSHTGQLLTKTILSHKPTSICCADLDHDGYSEIVLSAQEAGVLVLNQHFIPTKTIQSFEGDSVGIVLAVDVNQDGNHEIVVGTMNGAIVVVDYKGNRVWSYTCTSEVTDAVAYDIDGDGSIEVAFSTRDGQLFMLDHLGNLQWVFQIESTINTLSIGDVDSDGHLEILAGAYDQQIYILAAKGALKWIHQVVDWVLDSAVVDLDGDGHPEVLLGLGDSSIVALQFNDPVGILPRIAAAYKELANPRDLCFMLDVEKQRLLNVLTRGGLDPMRKLQYESYSLRILDSQIASKQLADALNNLLHLEDNLLSYQWRYRIGGTGTWIFRIDVTVSDDRQWPLIAAGSPGGKVTVLDGSGKLLWEYATGGWTLCVVFAELNGRCIVAGSADRYIYTLDGNGNLIWRRRMNDRVWAVERCDVDGDGIDEIIVGLDNGEVYVLNSYGEAVSNVSVNGRIRSIACSHPKEGTVKVAVSSSDGTIYLLTLYPDGFRHNKDTELRITLEDWAYRVWVGDIDDDGYEEVVAAGRSCMIQVYSMVGQLKWEYQFNDWIKDFDVKDVDKDGNLEIVAFVHDGLLSCIDSNGGLLSETKIAEWGRSVRLFIDSKLNKVLLIAGSGDGQVTCFEFVERLEITQRKQMVWQRLLENESISTTMAAKRLLQSTDQYLRAYAMRQLASTNIMNRTDGEGLLYSVQVAATDGSDATARSLAYCLVMLLNQHIENADKKLMELVTHPSVTVRLSLIQSLAKLLDDNSELRRTILAALVIDPDRQVRRELAFALRQYVADEVPDTIFMLAARLSQDESHSVKSEAERTLVSLLDHYYRSVFKLIRLWLKSNGADDSICKAANLVTNNDTAQILGIYCIMLSERSGSTSAALEKVKLACQIFASKHYLEHGNEIANLYGFLEEALRCNSTTSVQLAQRPFYQELMKDEVLLYPEYSFFVASITEIAQLFAQTHLALASQEKAMLLTQITALIESTMSRLPQIAIFAEAPLFDQVLAKWKSLAVQELHLIRGTAEVRAQFVSQRVHFDKSVRVEIKITNVGTGIAGNVLVELMTSNEYKLDVEQANPLDLGKMLPGTSIVAAFNLEPMNALAPDMRIVYKIRYQDVELKIFEFYDAGLVIYTPRGRAFVLIDPNPYIVGRPVVAESMFFGRKDVFESIRKSLVGKYQNNVVVLRGPRRVGKTSILFQLDRKLSETHVPVLIDMQARDERGMADFLYALAYIINTTISRKTGVAELEIEESEFARRPTLYFSSKFLPALEGLLRQKRLLLMFDEFEELDQRVNSGLLPTTVFSFLRSVIQHSTNIDFIFAGTQRLDSLTTHYWSVFFNIAMYNQVGFLDRESAIHLITDPVSEYELQYDSLAIERMLQLSNGHPFFLQLLCRELVEYHNQTRRSYLGVSDIDHVVDVVLEIGAPHLKYLWDERSMPERSVLLALAQELGQQDTMTESQLVGAIEQSGITLSGSDVSHAVSTLMEEQIIAPFQTNSSSYKYNMIMLKEWIRRNKSYQDIAAYRSAM